MTVMLPSIAPALVQGAAQLDFQRGCSLDDNPYEPGTYAYMVWQDEMLNLLETGEDWEWMPDPLYDE